MYKGRIFIAGLFILLMLLALYFSLPNPAARQEEAVKPAVQVMADGSMYAGVSAAFGKNTKNIPKNGTFRTASLNFR